MPPTERDTPTRCPTCDRPRATQTDFDACNDDCSCDRCRTLCWSRWNAGECCHNEPIDWRARALAAESRAERAEVSLAAAEREQDRWRHGVPIEGDYVCPDSLALTEMTKRAERAEALLKEAEPAVRFAEANDRHIAWADTLSRIADHLSEPKE